jgi:endoglucanase
MQWSRIATRTVVRTKLSYFASLVSVALSLTAMGCAAESSDAESEETETLGTGSQALSTALPFRGANLCGAEFGVDAWGNGAIPGTFGRDYTYPDPTWGYRNADVYMSKGMNTFRLPFRWERLQPNRLQAFNAAELGRLRTTVQNLTAKGASVIVEPQNFARYRTATIGSSTVPNSHFADFWARLANEFKGNSKVIFNLVNEPHDISTEQWLGAANAAIAGIRGAGATNLILVPGNAWTGAHAWSATWYGTPNATAMLRITDPKNNYAFEVHQYLDANSSGGGSQCVSPTIGSERMANFTRWLRANGKRGFLGEVGAPNTTTCLAAIDNILKHLESNADVYLGWTYWAGGPWWGSYQLSIEPSGTTDKPQMRTLLPHLSWRGTTTTTTTTTTCTSGTYEAEAMTRTAGGATTGGWNLWSNGALITSHAFRAGRTSVTVHAAGQSAGGVSPRMVVSVGGAVIGTTYVTSSSYAPYTFSFDATDGTKEIRVAFDNDAVIGSEDRNLLVDRVIVGCPTSTTTSCTAQSFEAESMSKTTGGATSGGWNLWSNGSISTMASLSAAPTTITVTAAGTYAGGAWPHFVVSVGGTPIGSGNASSTTYRDYAFTYDGSAGSKEVRVTFDNDYVAYGSDRNLLVDKVSLRCQ